MKKLLCKDCQHYYQHYGINNRKIYRLHCGHCAISKSKRRLPDASACEQFIPGLPDEESFVSKEYLSKEVLHYIMRLELLPEIADIATYNADEPPILR